MNIAVFCSGNGSNFQAIVNARKKGYLKTKIALMVCDNPAAYAIERAKKEGIKTLVVNRGDFPSKEAFEARIMKELKKEKVRLICLAGYMRILSQKFISRYRNCILNIHPAILPSFKGTHAVRDAVDYGVKLTGVTVHFVNEDMDAGPIILQRPVEIKNSDTEKRLTNRIHNVEHILYPEAVRMFLERRLRVIGRRVKIISLVATIFFAVFSFDSEAMYISATNAPVTTPHSIVYNEVMPDILIKAAELKTLEKAPTVNNETREKRQASQYEKLDLTAYPLYDIKELSSGVKEVNILNARSTAETPLTKDQIEKMRIENSLKAAKVVAEVMDSVNAKALYNGVNGIIDTATKAIELRDRMRQKYNLYFKADQDEAIIRYKKKF